MNETYVTKASMPPLDEYICEIKDIWDTHLLTNMGKKHEVLSEQLKRYLEIEYMELLVNGHMSLEMSLQALGLEGEVITTPFTFASTTHAIVRNNLEPIFCDINEDDYTIDTTQIERLITERTCAIMPVHVYGNICNVDEIDRIAKKYGLKVIYDAAHAFGVFYNGIGIGNFGDISCFSFHATKVFNTIEGGAACFKDAKIGEKLRQLKNFGIKDEEHVNGIGANAKMNEFCAAMGICNLRHVDREIEKRKQICDLYNLGLENIEGIKLNRIKKGVKSNYAYYPIVVDETIFGHSRDDVYNTLSNMGIYARKYFYPLTSDFECFYDKYKFCNIPVAKRISNRVLTLPLFPDMEHDVVQKICEIIISLSKTA